MNRVDFGMSNYLHTYEAYRIPKGTKVKDEAGNELVLSKEEDLLVLTEKSGKQLVKDRKAHNGVLQRIAELAALRTQEAASEKFAQDQAKVMAVYRAMAKGDIVPAADEKRLQEYSSDLYQAAKIAQSLARLKLAEREKRKSQWDEREEAAYQSKMEKLRKESDEAAAAVGEGARKFSQAQKARIVEIDAGDVDFSSMKVMNLGSGITGEHIDLSM